MLLDSKGRAKLSDFGLSHLAMLSATGGIHPTPQMTKSVTISSTTGAPSTTPRDAETDVNAGSMGNADVSGLAADAGAGAGAGAAVVARSAGVAVGGMLGTPAYLSPEELDPDNNHKVIFSLAWLFFTSWLYS